jgi:hypothetical protein
LPGVIFERYYMRIRVPGRFIAVLAILTAFLCLLPASTKVAVARPINWIDVGPIDPNSPTGDNDGVVLKNKSAASPTVLAAGTGSTATQKQYAPRVYDRSGMRLLFSVARRLDYWLYLLRY